MERDQKAKTTPFRTLFCQLPFAQLTYNNPNVHKLLTYILLYTQPFASAIALSILGCAFLVLTGPRFLRSKWTVFACAALSFSSLAFDCALTFISPVRDHLEAMIVSVAWQWMHGWPLYPALNATEIYSSVYGPLLFLITGLSLKWIGASFLVANIAPNLACWGSVLLVFLTSRRLLANQMALLLASLYVGLLMALGCGHWIRPDSYLIFIIAAACFISMFDKPWTLPLLGLLAGLAACLKIHCFLPIVPLILWRMNLSSWRDWLASVLTFVGVVALLYSMPGVSAISYYRLCRSMSETLYVFPLFLSCVSWFVILLLPFLFVAAPLYQKGRSLLNLKTGLVALSLMGGLFISFVPAVKGGGGFGDFVFFFPLVIFMYALAMRAFPSDKIMGALMSGMCIAFAFLSINYALTDYKNLTKRAAIVKTGMQEMRVYEDANPGKVLGVGYGDSIAVYFETAEFQSIQSLKQNFFVINVGSLLDLAASHVPMPRATIDEMMQKYDALALPAGEKPFSLPNVFTGVRDIPLESLFPDEMRAAFAKNFRLEHSGKVIDIWVKKNDPTSH